MSDVKTDSATAFDTSILEGQLMDVRVMWDTKQPDIPFVIYDPEVSYNAILIYSEGGATMSRVWDGNRGGFGPFYHSGLRLAGDHLVLSPPRYSSLREISIPLDRAEARPVRFTHLVNDEPDRNQLSAYQRMGSSEYLDRLTEQLHEIADTQNWCGEFDDLMEQIGLETRSKEYVTTVSVTADISMGVSNQLQEAIGYEIGDECHVSSATATIETTVRVYWTGRSDEEDTYVDNSEIEEALENQLRSVDIDDVLSWDVIDTETVD